MQRIVIVGMGIDARAALRARLDGGFQRRDLALADGGDRPLGQEHFRRFLNKSHQARSLMIELSSAA